MTPDPALSPDPFDQVMEDAGRDAVAIIAACLAEDWEGVETLVRYADTGAVNAVLSGIVCELLRQAGDPSEWVESEQRRARERA